MKKAHITALTPKIDEKSKPARRFRLDSIPLELFKDAGMNEMDVKHFLKAQKLGAFMEDYIGQWKNVVKNYECIMKIRTITMSEIDMNQFLLAL